MVGIDPLSQEVAAVRQLSEHHEMPVCAVHAPCLLITQRVWGTEPVGQARAARRDGRRGRRRRGRRAPAVPVAARLRRAASSRASPSSRSAPASRSRSRTCTPGGPPRGAEMEVYVPGWDPSERGLRQHHDRPLARGDRAVRPGRDGRAARRPAAAHPHDRRHRLGQGRAPGARAAARSRRPSFLEHLAGVGFAGHIVRGDQHPQGAPTGRRASSTCWSRWRSPG